MIPLYLFYFFFFSTFPRALLWSLGGPSLDQFKIPCAINSLSALKPCVSAFSSISPSLEMAGRKWSSLLHAGSHYRSLEVHVIANALHMDSILVWAPQNPLTITLTSPWGPSLSCLKRKRKKNGSKEVCYSASAKTTWEETAERDLARCLGWCHFLLAGQCYPHICLYFLIYFCHVGASLLERRLVMKHWAEAARSQVTNRLTAE